MNQLLSRRWAKPLVQVLCALPLLWLITATLLNQLGPNPAEALIRASGDWTLRFLCIVLAVTPLRVLSGTPILAQYRRMLGLWVYAYACFHLLTYSGFDMAFDPADIAKDIAKRPFILVGFSAWVTLTALAVTSSGRAVRALGLPRWRALHKLVYAVAGLAVLHFYWMRAGKHNFTEVAVYGAILAALLLWRVWHKLRARPKPPTRAALGVR